MGYWVHKGPVDVYRTFLPSPFTWSRDPYKETKEIPDFKEKSEKYRIICHVTFFVIMCISPTAAAYIFFGTVALVALWIAWIILYGIEMYFSNNWLSYFFIHPIRATKEFWEMLQSGNGYNYWDHYNS